LLECPLFFVALASFFLALYDYIRLARVPLPLPLPLPPTSQTYSSQEYRIDRLYLPVPMLEAVSDCNNLKRDVGPETSRPEGGGGVTDLLLRA